ncbi:MAG: hypothetical protein JRI66_10610 [Deltaproteobacteria bacterium]|nr:hypothetical protein [Deltaproteobacteria bacterium]
MIWLMGRQKRGISMLCLQRMLETPTDKPRFAAMRMVPRVSSDPWYGSAWRSRQ